MKVCIYGAGAIGGFIGAKLAGAGADVSLVARGPHLAAMRDKGLTLRMNGTEETVRVRASQDPGELGPQDYVVVALKAHSLPGAVDAMRRALNGLSINVGYQRREGPIPLDASFARRLVTQGTYDRTDLVLTYATKVHDQPVRLQLNVNNLQDHVYADRYLGYADPRIIRFSVSTRF